MPERRKKPTRRSQKRRRLRYVIFAPSGDEYVPSLVRCLEYAAATGWQSEGVILGRWDAVTDMLMRRAVDVVIVDDRDHLPPDRIPRLVIVREQLNGPPVAAPPPGVDIPPAQRRPQLR